MHMHSYLYVLLSLLIVIEAPVLGMKRFFSLASRTPIPLQNNRTVATTAQEQPSHQNNELIVSPYPFTYFHSRIKCVVENYEQAGPQVHKGLMLLHDLRLKMKACKREGNEEDRMGCEIAYGRTLNALLLFELKEPDHSE